MLQVIDNRFDFWCWELTSGGCRLTNEWVPCKTGVLQRMLEKQ